jgi:competence protein ComEC
VKPTLRITLLFILGIILQYWIPVDGYIILCSWLIVFILLLFTLIERKGKKMRFHKFMGALIYAQFLVSGMLSYAASQPDFYQQHYSRHSITGDLLTIQIKESTEGTTTTKAIGEVVGVGYNSFFRKTDGNVLLFIETGMNLQPGHIIITAKKPSSIENKNNPGEFDARYFWKSKGILEQLYLREMDFDVLDYTSSLSSIFDYSRAYLKKVLEEELPEDIAPLAIALSLGDKSKLNSSTRASFASAGAMHVLAVSGLHVGILLAMFQWIFLRIPSFRNRNLYIIFALIGIWCFALLTGLAPSVFRATLMFTILGFGQLLGKRFFNLNALLISALVLLMLDGKVLFDIGFQLSYLAMLGILFFFKPVRNIFTPPYRWMNFIWEGVAVGIAAQIGTLPISLYYFHQFPNYFILTNIGLLFLAGIALGSVLIFFVLHAIPVINALVSEAITLIYKGMLWFIQLIELLPGAVTKGFSISFLEMLLIYLLIITSYYATQHGQLRRWYASVFLLFVLSTFVNIRRISNDYRKEFVVFNDIVPIILVKHIETNYFIYPEGHPKAEKSLEFLAQGYQQKYGGKNQYIALRLHEGVDFSTGEMPEISLFRNPYEIEIDLRGRSSYVLPITPHFNENFDHIIVGKWCSKIELQGQIDTKKGAFRSVL